MVGIDKTNLNIIYTNRPTKTYVHLYCLFIATITYSETTESWFVNFINISQDVVEVTSKNAADFEVRNYAAKFLEFCMES